jgi:hypothetical protein
MHVIKLLGQSAAVGVISVMVAFVLPTSAFPYRLALLWAVAAGCSLLVALAVRGRPTNSAIRPAAGARGERGKP